MLTFFSFPPASNAMKRLSGDQKIEARMLCSVPGKGLASRALMARSHKRVAPSEPTPEKPDIGHQAKLQKLLSVSL